MIQAVIKGQPRNVMEDLFALLGETRFANPKPNRKIDLLLIYG